MVYLGVKVYFEERAGRLSVHTTVYDREFSYPYHIVRYPEFTSVAPRSNLGALSELPRGMLSYERLQGICWDGLS